MSDKRIPPLAELPHRVRERAATFKANLRQWQTDVRADPSLLWRNTPIRLLFWLALGICAILTVRSLAKSVLPAGTGPTTEQPTQLATLYVACTNPDCRESYTTKQPMDFAAWPLTCQKCGQPTVYRAKLCPFCHKWYATAPGRADQCPFCAAEEPEEPAKPRQTGPVDPDDAEDGW